MPNHLTLDCRGWKSYFKSYYSSLFFALFITQLCLCASLGKGSFQTKYLNDICQKEHVRRHLYSVNCKRYRLTLNVLYLHDGGLVKWKLLSHVQLFVTSWTVVHGILQPRILEWVAFPFSRGSSQPRDWTQVSHGAGRFSTSWATREAHWGVGWHISHLT